MDHKMNTLLLCVCGLLAMFWQNGEYHFSFMNDAVMMMIIILFICFVYFPKSWFHCIWGLLVGLAIMIPLILHIINGTNNMVAIVFDSVLSVITLGYFAFWIWKKIYKR